MDIIYLYCIYSKALRYNTGMCVCVWLGENKTEVTFDISTVGRRGSE